MRAVPGLSREPERSRLQATLALEMNAALPQPGATAVLGDVDRARLDRSIALMVAGSGLPRTPSAAEIFTAAHLPPLHERTRA